MARHWYRVAAETEALRDKYNIAPSDPEAVPQKLRTQAKPHEAPSRTEARGKFLHAQVVSTHKRSVMAAHHRTPKTNIENVQLAQARDTNLRAQEAHREGRPAGITTAMLSPEQRKHLQKMRAEKASQTTRKEKIMQQPAQPSVEQRIADQRKQRSNRAQELARLKERAQKRS